MINDSDRELLTVKCELQHERNKLLEENGRLESEITALKRLNDTIAAERDSMEKECDMWRITSHLYDGTPSIRAILKGIEEFVYLLEKHYGDVC